MMPPLFSPESILVSLRKITPIHKTCFLPPQMTLQLVVLKNHSGPERLSPTGGGWSLAVLLSPFCLSKVPPVPAWCPCVVRWCWGLRNLMGARIGMGWLWQPSPGAAQWGCAEKQSSPHSARN